MDAIVSVTADWGIGHAGRLLVDNRADMRRFVELTMGGTVLCGQTTFESFPGGALRGRRNVVLSVDAGFVPGDADVVRSLDEARRVVAGDPHVWVIGGESVYRQLLDECERAYVTKNDVIVPADAFFPDLDASDSWLVEEVADGGVTDAGVTFRYVTYRHA